MTNLMWIGLQAALIYALLGGLQTSVTARLMFAFLSLVSTYGLAAFGAGLIDREVKIDVLQHTISIFLIIAFLTEKSIARAKSGVNLSRKFAPHHAAGPFVLLVFAACMFLGVATFGWEFTPSSMTGDPPRHFARVVQFQHENAAALWKPTFPIAGALWLGVTTSLDPVLSFTIFNVFILGGLGSALYFAVAHIQPALQGRRAACIAVLGIAGYPCFSLQYGYFALNLAAAFFFWTMFALLIWSQSRGSTAYGLALVLGTGVVLTHVYLLPPLLILYIAMYMHLKSQSATSSLDRVQSINWAELLATVAWFSLISILSNSWTSMENLEGQLHAVKLRGLVNESFMVNIAPFLPLAAIGAFLYLHSGPQRVLGYLFGLLLLYSALLFFVGVLGGVAPYYINRTQVVLLPLVLLLNAIVIHDFSVAFKFNFEWICFFLLIVVFGAYWVFRNDPLHFGKESYIGLLRRDEFVYLENPRNAGYAPLQLTTHDVRFLKALRRDYRICFDKPVSRIAVLGSDHSVQWIEHFAGIRPSLFDRSDGYVDFAGYYKNFQLWMQNPEEKYVIIADHFEIWNRNDLRLKILESTSLICQGDAVKIYRKNDDSRVFVR